MAGLPRHQGQDSCRLDEHGVARRNVEFADVVDRGLRLRQRGSDGEVVLVFDNHQEMEPDLRALVEREAACCSFFSFDVAVDNDQIVLRVAAPIGKTAYLDALYQATAPSHSTKPGDARPSRKGGCGHADDDPVRHSGRVADG